MFRALLIAIPVALVLMIAHLATHLGAFKPVELSEQTGPALILLGVSHIGPYHKMNDQIKSVEDWAKSQNIDCRLSFGEYFDDPALVEEARLRSRGGCIVSEAPNNIPNNFEVQQYPADRRYILAVFTGSPAIGPYKVYNKVEEYRLEKRLKSAGSPIEVYEVHNEKEMTTTYYFPVE